MQIQQTELERRKLCSFGLSLPHSAATAGNRTGTTGKFPQHQPQKEFKGIKGGNSNSHGEFLSQRITAAHTRVELGNKTF